MTTIGDWPAVPQSNKSGASFRAYASRGGFVISRSSIPITPVATKINMTFNIHNYDNHITLLYPSIVSVFIYF